MQLEELITHSKRERHLIFQRVTSKEFWWGKLGQNFHPHVQWEGHQRHKACFRGPLLIMPNYLSHCMDSFGWAQVKSAADLETPVMSGSANSFWKVRHVHQWSGCGIMTLSTAFSTWLLVIETLRCHRIQGGLTLIPEPPVILTLGKFLILNANWLN